MQSVYPSRAAEKILFRELFRDAPTVQQNGGTLVGAPKVKSGIFLDGSTQYVTHAIQPMLFAPSQLTFVMEFAPDFIAEDGVDHYLFDTTNGARYYSLKTSTDRLVIVMADIQIATIAPAVWAPYWRTGERNVLVIAAESGSTNVWLNGTYILINDPTTWITKYPTELFTGASFIGTFPFDGVIKYLDIHGCLLEQADVDAIQDGSLFRYMQNCDVYLDMAEAIIDGSNDRTLDKSRHGRDFQLGDGVGAGTPTWESPGFGLDGVSQYFQKTSASDVLNNTEQSLVFSFRPDFAADDGLVRYIFDTTAGSRYLVAKYNTDTLLCFLGNVSVFSVPLATFAPFWRVGGENVLIIAGTSGDTDAWLNGHRIVTADNTVWTPADPALITLGTRTPLSDFFAGQFDHFSAFSRKLSPIQARDFLIQLGGAA